VKGFVCYTPGCGRTPGAGQALCNSCQRVVPTTTKIALQGHDDELGRVWSAPPAERDGWRAFVTWSREQTLKLAALQAWQARELPTDKLTLGHVVRLQQELGA